MEEKKTKITSITSLKDLKKMLHKKHIFGVIGHRNLLESDNEDNSKLYEEINKKLSEIINIHKLKTKDCILLSPLAKGADQLVAKVAIKLKIDVIGIPAENLQQAQEFLFDNPHNKSQHNSFLCNLKEILKIKKINLEELFDFIGRFILLNSNSVFFLWDGVFTGNKGGTSVSYYQAMKGFGYDDLLLKKHHCNRNNKIIEIYHISIPRENNIYPVGKRYLNERELGINLLDYTRVYPYLWHKSSVKHPIKQHKIISNANREFSLFRNSYIWQYGVPAFLILTMLITGICTFENSNIIWELLNLIKLPSGDLIDAQKFIALLNSPKHSIISIIPIIASVILIPYSIVITLIYALSNDRRILLTKIPRKNRILILGLGWKGSELADNLKNANGRKKRIIVIEKDKENANIKSSIRKGIRVIHGNFTEEHILKRINWYRFKDIYILAKDDETNIRTVQLLDKLSNKINGHNSPITLHIHLDNYRNKFFINNALQSNDKLKLNCFNVYDNTIRKILLKHPLDKFYLNKIRGEQKVELADTVKIVILGYNNAAQSLFRYCFTHCIYETVRNTEIEVYLENKDDIEFIKNDIPYVFEEEDLSKGSSFLKEFHISKDKNSIESYVYKNLKKVIVKELPKSEFEILSNADYINNLECKNVTSIFTCIDDGLRSSAYLSSILPALQVKKQEINADVQVFCYFNFPEEKENTFIEESINNLADNIPVFFFGNFTEEFTDKSIKNQELDELAKLINEFFWKSKNTHQIRMLRMTNNSLTFKLYMTLLSDVKNGIYSNLKNYIKHKNNLKNVDEIVSKLIAPNKNEVQNKKNLFENIYNKVSSVSHYVDIAKSNKLNFNKKIVKRFNQLLRLHNNLCLKQIDLFKINGELKKWTFSDWNDRIGWDETIKSKIKLIETALLEYSKVIDSRLFKQNLPITKKWDNLNEFHKESNRLNADHLFVKLRILEEAFNKEYKSLSTNTIWDVLLQGLSFELNTRGNKRKMENSLSFTTSLNGKLNDITEIEHRRWCAERLFYGWKPFEKQNEPELNEWFVNKSKYYEPQKIHLDLKDYKNLDEQEKDKDLVITENLDLIFELLK